MAAGSRRVEDGQERSEDRKSGEARMRGEERKQEDAVTGKGGRRREGSGGMEKGDAKGRGRRREGSGGMENGDAKGRGRRREGSGGMEKGDAKGRVRRREGSGGMENGDAKGRDEGKAGELRRTELQEPFCSLILDFVEYGEHYGRVICNTEFWNREQ